MTEQKWIVIARKYLGTTETKGSGTTPVIRTWLVGLKAWWTDDETPWCGTFVAACIKESGLTLPKHWYRAMGWLDWGIPIAKPVPGCVAIYSRSGGGHVNFVLGRDGLGRIVGIGGNQGDRVSIAAFDPLRVVGYRWPAAVPLPLTELTLFAANGQPTSNHEA